MEFRVLGPLEVVDGERAIELGGSKQRSVLAMLVLRAGRVVSTEALVDGLWGDAPPATAAKSLQVYVSRLRKTLGDDVIVTRAPGYMLDAGPDAIDVARVETLVEQARGEPSFDAAVDIEHRPCSLARSRARGPRRRAVRPGRGRQAGGAPPERARGPHRRRPRARQARRARSRARDRYRGATPTASGWSGSACSPSTARDDRRKRSRSIEMLGRGSWTRSASSPIPSSAISNAASCRRIARSQHQRRLMQRMGQPVVARARRRAALALAGAAIASAVAVTATVLLRDSDRSSIVAAPNSVAMIDPRQNIVVGVVPLGERPTRIAVHGDDVWVLHPDRGTVSHISRATNAVLGTVGVGGAPSSLVAGARGVWVSDARNRRLTLIEPERLTVAATVADRTTSAGGPVPGRGSARLRIRIALVRVRREDDHACRPAARARDSADPRRRHGRVGRRGDHGRRGVDLGRGPRTGRAP